MNKKEKKEQHVQHRALTLPYGECIKRRRAHIVGIPPKLREHRDRIFSMVPNGAKVAVEIGTLQGWFAWRCMKHLPPDCILYCVDPFKGSEYNDPEYNLKIWRQNLAGHDRAILLRGFSHEVLWGRGEIDFLFIDGSHEEEAVVKDLETWIPRVRPGGLVSGHDIDGPSSPGVIAALKRCGIKYKVEPDLYSFTGIHETPCWYFYK